MELCILGSQGPFAAPGEACSSYLVTNGKRSLVMDLGSGSLANLQRWCRISAPEAIILSHLHYDHMGDVFILKYALAQLRQKDPSIRLPRLYLPASPQEEMRSLTVDGILEAHIIEPGKVYSIAGMNVRFYLMPHPVESYAIELECSEKRMVYSGDSRFCDDICTLANKADLFLVDGGLLISGENSPHMSVAQACIAGKGAAKTVVTHSSPFSSEMDIEKELFGGAVMAKVGQRYVV